MSRATRQTHAKACNPGSNAGRGAHAQGEAGRRGAVSTSSRAPLTSSLTTSLTYLSVSVPQVYSLVRSGELPAVKIGGRGVWRVDRGKLDAYLEQLEKETAAWPRATP